jgi:dTDP-4-dehydrorhamnose reductase
MSDFFKDSYFATRPNSEKLINKKLNDINQNLMSDWVLSLKTYLNLYYK